MKKFLVIIVICIFLDPVYMHSISKEEASKPEPHDDISVSSSLLNSPSRPELSLEMSEQAKPSGQESTSTKTVKLTKPPANTNNMTDARTTNEGKSENVLASEGINNQTNKDTKSAVSEGSESSRDSDTGNSSQNSESSNSGLGNSGSTTVANIEEPGHYVEVNAGVDKVRTNSKITNVSRDSLKDGDSEKAIKTSETDVMNNTVVSESPLEKVSSEEQLHSPPKSDVVVSAVLPEEENPVGVDNKEPSDLAPSGEVNQKESNFFSDQEDVAEQGSANEVSSIKVTQELESTNIKGEGELEDYDKDRHIVAGQDNEGINIIQESTALGEHDNQGPNDGFRISSDSQTTNDIKSSGSLTNDEGSHFFAYFLTVMVTAVVFYLVFHNKQRIIALIIEGRSERSRRRPGRSQYRKLDNNLEEAMTATKGSTPSTFY